MDLKPPILADGSVHTEIRARLPAGGLHPVLYNERDPDLVRRVHADFARAGAKALRTNTRDANRVCMAPLGLQERCEALNNVASALLYEVAGAQGIRMGVIGAVDVGPAAGAPGEAERDRAYAEQAIYLSDTGVTFFLLEHFTRVEEAERLLAIVRRNSDAPVLTQLRFDDGGRSADGLSAAAAARRLVRAGADALGVSCGPWFDRLPDIVAALLDAGRPVSLLPGIATPGVDPPYPGARPCEPREFADHMLPYVERGVAIVGGCCGVGPAHIAALSGRLTGT